MKMTRDLGAADRQLDLHFLNAMIPHHEGAIAIGKRCFEQVATIRNKTTGNEHAGGLNSRN